LRDQGHALGRVPGLTLIAALGFPPSRHPPEGRNHLAGSLQKRGNAKLAGGDRAGAIADYYAAIALKQAIRAAPGGLAGRVKEN
jgi:hypothetical protein